MRLTEDTQEVAEGLAAETAPAKPAPPSARPDAASAMFGLGFGLAGATVVATTILEELGQHSEAVTRFVSIAWILVTVAWLTWMNRRAVRRVQATVQVAEREMAREFKRLRADMTAELERFRTTVILRVAEAREDGYADGFVAGTSASNGRGTIRAIREAGP